ncbi:hypothetical protein LEN26_015813 [Aphanomyces euteiches]|nr:hypothetical protein LEN26_015813 [Aphanomyces euteiches]KAH9105116.1 hypothetical protein AeMF1_018972 [Aphanomyces euteiches]KAH9194124.1 hypothetical protein AeNC1_003899 [Aphanomyces euteiches]
MDQKRRLLRVDHLPFLALQMTECNTLEIDPPTIEAASNDDASIDDAPLRGSGNAETQDKEQKKVVGKIELEACYTRSDVLGRFPDKGALIGDVYDDIPDESDEAVYDALEKAYNAAFSMSSVDRIERDRRLHAASYEFRPLAHNSPTDVMLTKRQSTAESFDAWKERLLDGRKDAFLAVMRKKAFDDIKDYREYFIQQRQRKVNALRNRQLEQGVNVAAIWKEQIISGKSDVIEAATKMDEWMSRRKTVLRDLAKRCRDVHLKRQTRLKSKDAFDEKKSGRIEGGFDSPRDVSLTASTENRIVVSKPRELLADNAKLIQFLLEEADMFVEMLLGNRSPTPYIGKPQTANMSEEEIIALAEITSSKLYHDRCNTLKEFDTDWKRLRIHHPEKSVSRPAFNGTVAVKLDVANPFLNCTDSSRWDWLSKSNESVPPDYSQATEVVRTLLDRPTVSPSVHRQMMQLYTRGVNGLLFPTMPISLFHQVIAFIAELALADDKWGPHVIVTTKVEEWLNAFTQVCPQIKIMAYWGSPDDRQKMRTYWSPTSLCKKNSRFHVVLTNSRVVNEDIRHFHQAIWQTILLDVPWPNEDTKSWTYILGLRSRQRWMILDSTVQVDLRLMLHFLTPELFDSKQKVMAWGSSGLEDEAIQTLRSIVQRMCAFEGSAESVLDASTLLTTDLCASEREVLVKLNSVPVMEYVLAQPITPPSEMDYLKKYQRQNRLKIVVDTKHLLMRTPKTPMIENPIALSLPKPNITDPKLIACKHCAKTFMTSSGLLKHTKSDHAPAGTWTCRKCGVDCGTMALRNAHERQEHDETIIPSNKPSNTDTTPSTPTSSAPKPRRSNAGSKKRVTRCGKCAGCLSGDCMECGHCQDMKKYGGPGLRKQSCKNRKCTNPQILGSASQDDEDQKLTEEFMDGQSSESAESSESEREETNGKVVMMEEEESEDEDATDDMPLKTPKSGKTKKSRSSSSNSKSAIIRTRVMRCGVCVGCLAPDCLKCRHCMDMKKYGGPGLRKQSCKSRKCVTPKVVLLNQGQEGEEGDMLLYEEPTTPRSTPSTTATTIASSTKNTTPNTSSSATVLSATPQWERDTLLDAAASLAHNVYQQNQLNRFLKITCLTCDAKFLNQSLKSLHEAVIHHSRQNPKWKRQLVAERLSSPAFQFTLISTDSRRKKPVDFEPVGYAKLVGPGLCYYMLQSHAVLGRVAPEWKERYRSLGLELSRGYPGGVVDCHLGDDMMISHEHVKIRWDLRRQRFVIECLSILTPLSVNGQEVHFGAAPVTLASRSLIQVGAFYFFFLLPVANLHRSAPPKSSAHEMALRCRQRQCMPRQEVYAWLASKKASRQEVDHVKREREDGDAISSSPLKRPKLNEDE